LLFQKWSNILVSNDFYFLIHLINNFVNPIGKPIEYDPDFKGAIIDRKPTDFKCFIAFTIIAILWIFAGIIGIKKTRHFYAATK
jgi:hypothetical protein